MRRPSGSSYPYSTSTGRGFPNDLVSKQNWLAISTPAVLLLSSIAMDDDSDCVSCKLLLIEFVSRVRVANLPILIKRWARNRDLLNPSFPAVDQIIGNFQYCGGFELHVVHRGSRNLNRIYSSASQ